MTTVYRTETGHASRSSVFRIAGLLALAGVASFASPALAQQDQPMDDEDGVAISCADGTELLASFDEDGVKLKMADGSVLSLRQLRADDSGYSYSNGKFTLSGDAEGAQWIVGKKAPVTCEVRDDSSPAPFDAPITIDTFALPKDKANPDAQPQVNCYRFPGFMVKEVDLGEKGAERLAIAPQNSACERNAAKDEEVIKDDTAGYFLGAKNGYVFFQAADGWNGGMPFVVYSAHPSKHLFEDSFEGDDFHTVDVDGATLALTFRRSYTADCSLFHDGSACAQRVRKITGLGSRVALPDCKTAYESEMKRTPDYAKEIAQLPSVISYEAMLKYDGRTATVSPLAGETSCNVPD